jgi:hypothetical protein
MINFLLPLLLSPMLSRAIDESMGARISENTLLASTGLAGGCMHLRSKLAGLFLDHVSTVQHRCNIRGWKERKACAYGQEWLSPLNMLGVL